jgi:glycosyltransferase involved in cell wall biosynthesis
MRIALIADTFPPLRTSGAVQLRDLSRELVRQGHELTVLLPSPEIKNRWLLEEVDGAKVLRLRAPRTKDLGYVRRTVGEFLMPFAMLRNLRRSPLRDAQWDGVIWYSPSIFHGPLASALKQASNCKGYLIVRDIFPEWAADMGLMSRGLPYIFFRAVARYQYSVADTIGVQTPGNLSYFRKWEKCAGRELEVLQNWLGNTSPAHCRIQLGTSALAGRKIFVYAGNMGVAQGMDILIDLAERMRVRTDVGFIFVGRGSEATRLASRAASRGLDNTLFFDEIDPDEVPSLYTQCHVGMVALDSRHKSHNIPGKFLTYIQSGLPVLACINRGNDLTSLILQEQVGSVTEDFRVESLQACAEAVLDAQASDPRLAQRCRSLFERCFDVGFIAGQVVDRLARRSGPANLSGDIDGRPGHEARARQAWRERPIDGEEMGAAHPPHAQGGVQGAGGARSVA